MSFAGGGPAACGKLNWSGSEKGPRETSLQMIYKIKYQIVAQFSTHTIRDDHHLISRSHLGLSPAPFAQETAMASSVPSGISENGPIFAEI